MKNKTLVILTAMSAAAIIALTGCTTTTSKAMAEIAKANAKSNAHVKISVSIPPNQITYERWVPVGPDTNTPAQ